MNARFLPGLPESRLVRLLGSACLVATIAGGCSDGGPHHAVVLSGTVTGVSGDAVAGATVYLVPSGSVSTQPITAAGILDATTADFDEPLEDAVRLGGTAFPNASTTEQGGFSFAAVPDGSYFVYVQPASTDTEHLPGGSLCRVARSSDTLRGGRLSIELSSSPPTGTGYAGMSTCLACHPQHATLKGMAHRLGFRVPGKDSGLQDSSGRPEIDEGLSRFLRSAAHTGGTPVYVHDYDRTRGFDKFKTSRTDPVSNVSAILWLWQSTADSRYKITFQNVGNPSDPNNLATSNVVLAYGGAVEKQRYMIDWPGRKGLYPLLQFQAQGDDAHYDRTRKVFRDYHLDWFWDDKGTPSDLTDDVLKAPAASKNIQLECMACHATGYKLFVDPVTNETLCDSVEDALAEYDIDGDGMLNDLNIGCETCHGPGAQHATSFSGRWIVSPQVLSPSREVMLCVRCHDRPVGNGTVKNDQPLNAADEFPPAGISRADYLASHVSRPGPAASDFWDDFHHSKSHHQQASDFLKSSHYRNARELVTCAGCHDLHGGTGHTRGLLADPAAPDTALCMRCHEEIGDTPKHTQQVLGWLHPAGTTACVDCHMAKTAKTGSGHYGALIAPPTGGASDADKVYWTNDVTSHVFDVPRKTNPGVAGVQPGKAMPIPYTNRCGTCHNVWQLRWLK